MDSGLYVHVPFCRGKCAYCDFNSYPVESGVPGDYLETLSIDAAGEAEHWGDVEFASVYLGGGTPTLLSVRRLECLMGTLREHFRMRPDCEISIECNPGTVDGQKMLALRRLGINRISVGVQSLAAHELGVLGRDHSPTVAMEALDCAALAGFSNVNADIIIGIPGQTVASLGSTLRRIMSRVSHVSAYMLTLGSGTALERRVSAGIERMPDEDTMLDLYWFASGLLGASGFRRYEISNWSVPGLECRHNLTYWDRGDYVGLGAGAHSHRGGRRWVRVRSPEAYMARIRSGKSPVEDFEILRRDQILVEEIMLGLRTSRGVNLARLRTDFGITTSGVDSALADLFACGLIAREGKHLQLTTHGLVLHDTITEILATALCESH